MDPRKSALLEALKIGSLEGGETRLYRRGKLPGLFAQRTRLAAEVASQAVADGLLEMTRVETVGKTAIEWVRVTPAGMDYLLDAESPVRALEELRDALAVNEQSVPLWAARMQARVDELSQQIATEVAGMRAQLEAMSRRVAQTMDRMEQQREQIAQETTVPWGADTLALLDRRRQVGLGARCPLADLFTALREKYPQLTIKEFHAGLADLRRGNAITLLPSSGNGDTPGPEYALLDGASVYYYLSATED